MVFDLIFSPTRPIHPYCQPDFTRERCKILKYAWLINIASIIILAFSQPTYQTLIRKQVIFSPFRFLATALFKYNLQETSFQTTYHICLVACGVVVHITPGYSSQSFLLYNSNIHARASIAWSPKHTIVFNTSNVNKWGNKYLGRNKCR